MPRELKLRITKWARTHSLPLVIVGAVAGVGLVTVIASRAAGPFVAAEPENGMLSGLASVISDPTASGGSGVRFGSGTAGRIFVGDFETGNFSQWPSCQSVALNSHCANYTNNHYSLAMSTNPKRQGNYAAKFELHDGDNPGFSPGTERTEVSTNGVGTGDEGDERWFQWSTQFGSQFPLNHATQGWGVVSQWHDQSNGSPPVSFNVDRTDGKWGLSINRQSSPGVYLGNLMIWEAPLAQGTWHDIKIHIKWSASDTVGFVELWHNGSRVTFTGAPCAGLIRCTIRTLTPGGGGTYFKQGIYRSGAVNGTAIVYHDGFVASTTESGL